MKNKTYNEYLINAITNTKIFQIIFALGVATSIYGAFALIPEQKNLYDAILISHSHQYFNILIFSIVIVNTIYTCYTFYKDKNFIIRLKTKKNILKTLINICIRVNLILIICIILIYLMLANIKNLGFYQSNQIYDYNIKTNVYSIFYIFRYYIITLIFAVINCILYNKLSSKVIILDIIFLIIYTLLSSQITINNSIGIIPWQHLIINNYGTFINELSSSLLYLLILEIIIIISYKICNKKMNNNVFKYIIKNDMNYILKKYKFYIIGFIVPSIILTLQLLQKNKGLDLYIRTLGLNISDTSNIIEVLAYFFIITYYIILLLMLYIKDIKNNVDKIYLRTKFKNYIINKEISNLLILLITFMLQSLIITILGTIFGKIQINNILINLLITTFNYITIMSQLALLLYIIYKIFSKIKYLTLGLTILFIYYIPTNIIKLIPYTNYLLVLNIILISLNIILNHKYNKKIIQSIGGV